MEPDRTAPGPARVAADSRPSTDPTGSDGASGDRASNDGASNDGATITVCPDGPLLVRGDVAIVGVDGEPVERRRRTVALCRCGRSALAPYCDGSHKVRRGGAGSAGAGRVHG